MTRPQFWKLTRTHPHPGSPLYESAEVIINSQQVFELKRNGELGSILTYFYGQGIGNLLVRETVEQILGEDYPE